MLDFRKEKNMKIKIILIALLVGLFSSCGKYLELKPKNTLVVNSMEEARLMMSSYLASMTQNATYQVSFNGRKLSWPFNRDIMANFVFYGDDVDMMTVLSNAYSKKYEVEYYEDKDWKGQQLSKTIWNQLYSHIGYLTAVINEGEKFKDQKNYAMVMGEALTIRAYFIFKLQQYFAPLDEAELGIPLNLDLDEFRNVPRWQQKDIYAQIIKDLEKALSLGGYDAQWNVFHTADISKFILSQVYAYKAATVAKESTDWEYVAKYTDELGQRTSLEATAAEFTAEFRPMATGYVKNNPHSLLTIGWLGSPRNNLSSLWGVGTSRMKPNPELLALYSVTDIRKKSFFDASNNFNKFDFLFFKVEDYQLLFRLADTYLLNIEADWKTGKTAEAKRKLAGFIQQRTGENKVIADADFERSLYNERRKELCAELDARWIDLKRNRVAFQREATLDNGQGKEMYKLEANDYRYTLPIPEESELNYNSKIAQNPGW